MDTPYKEVIDDVILWSIFRS